MTRENLEKLIDREYKNDVNFINCMIKLKKLAKYKAKFGYTSLGLFISTIVLSILSFLSGFLFGETAFKMVIFITFAMGVSTIVMFLLFINICSSKRGIFKYYEKVAKYYLSEDKLSRIYVELFEDSYLATTVTDIEFKVNNHIIEYYKNLENFYETRFNKKMNSVNNLVFKFKGKRALFFTNNPYLTIISNGKSSTTYYTTIGEFYLKNEKFDSAYNNIKIIPGTKHDINYQTESITFNDKYDINIKDNDIRAPMFLTPKLIDRLTKIKISKYFKEFGIKKNFYVFHESTSSYIMDSPLGVIDFSSIKSYQDFKDKAVIKITRDFYLLSRSIQYVDCVY
ncbi:hypothetical protein SCORR_v1c06980 [Spiroplasma corruscae]|uniref:DUF3137 domain-containing protein n=1 Tax=Spiroplasma corruscae TaxID=216934 RepID=A0A222EPL9_9MOLU|nr:hypothetical protein [Spiroplasma corruscae]ASP28470.1 hypothetical protein SCORR_v1c06980 [Spiroplasma corruscae]